MSDTISDFLTMIRNAYQANRETCTAKYSKMHKTIAEILQQEGYLEKVSEGTDPNGHKNLVLTLKYVDDTPALMNIKRISTPGRRLYFQSTEIPRTLNGLGISILTTSRDVMR